VEGTDYEDLVLQHSQASFSFPFIRSKYSQHPVLKQSQMWDKCGSGGSCCDFCALSGIRTHKWQIEVRRFVAHAGVCPGSVLLAFASRAFCAFTDRLEACLMHVMPLFRSDRECMLCTALSCGVRRYFFRWVAWRRPSSWVVADIKCP
jgi:hypothetical protein